MGALQLLTDLCLHSQLTSFQTEASRQRPVFGPTPEGGLTLCIWSEFIPVCVELGVSLLTT